MRWLPFGVALAAVCASLAAFIAGLETTSAGWELAAVLRGSQVLVLLALAMALVVERQASKPAIAAQVGAVLVSVAFVIVGLAKLHSTPYGIGLGRAAPWTGEASLLGLAALAFALIGVRVRSAVPVIGLAAGVCAAFACAIYAITLEFNFNAELWWSVAFTLGLLSASAAGRMLKR